MPCVVAARPPPRLVFRNKPDSERIRVRNMSECWVNLTDMQDIPVPVQGAYDHAGVSDRAEPGGGSR